MFNARVQKVDQLLISTCRLLENILVDQLLIKFSTGRAINMLVNKLNLNQLGGALSNIHSWKRAAQGM